MAASGIDWLIIERMHYWRKIEDSDMSASGIELTRAIVERSQSNLRQALRDLESLSSGPISEYWRQDLLQEISYSRYELLLRGVDPKIPDTVLAQLILEGYDIK